MIGLTIVGKARFIWSSGPLDAGRWEVVESWAAAVLEIFPNEGLFLKRGNGILLVLLLGVIVGEYVNSVMVESVGDLTDTLELGREREGGDDGIESFVGVIGLGRDDLKLATRDSRLFIWSSIPWILHKLREDESRGIVGLA